MAASINRIVVGTNVDQFRDYAEPVIRWLIRRAEAANPKDDWQTLIHRARGFVRFWQRVHDAALSSHRRRTQMEGGES